MTEEPNKLTRSGRSNCWISEAIVTMAKALAASEKSTISEVLEEVLRGPITRRYRQLIARELHELGGEAGGA